MNKKKRLGLFAFYDKQGIVDDYVIYLLDSLKGIISEWVIIVNGEICNEGLTILKSYSDKVYVRENRGFDAGAYKEAVLEHLGQEYIQRYDELLIMNDTFYGPFFSWKKVWDKMSKCNYDMWGITGHGAIPQKSDAHIQSYFIVFNKAVIKSGILFSFFSNLETHDSIGDTVADFEVGLSQYIRKAGFRLGVYVNDSNSKSSEIDNGYTYNLSNMACEELIRDYDCPILKRKSLVGDRNQYYNLNTYKAIEYIDEHCAYDVNMIKFNILRIFECDDIKLAFKYHFIVSDEKDEECIAENADKIEVAICILMDSIDIQEEFKKQMAETNATYDVYYVFDDYQNRICRLAERYQYICIFDECMDDVFYASVFYRKKHWCTWNNLLGSDRYIRRIIDIFDANKELGAILAPCDKQYMAGWFLPKTIMMLAESGYWNHFADENHANSLEDALNKCGCFAGYVYEKTYSERLLPFLEYSLMHNTDKRKSLQISLDTILKNVEYKKLYIYGFGSVASLITDILAAMGVSISGYIVSDCRTIRPEDVGKVQGIDDYTYTVGDIIIIGVGENFAAEVEANLKRKRICKYYRLSF